MEEKHIYVIGKRGLGVIFITTSPLRASFISDEEIKKYEVKHQAENVDGYARIAGQAQLLINRNDGNPNTVLNDQGAKGIEDIVKMGVTMSNADFSFCSPFNDTGLGASRMSFMPIEQTIDQVAPDPLLAGTHISGLQAAVLRDDPINLDDTDD